MTAVPNPPKPVTADAPESLENLQNYQIAQATPLPAALNGVYCKGGACQYRVAPPPPTFPPPMTPPPIPIGGANAGREFCRGMGCIAGMGFPGDPALEAFKLNCIHLFQDVGGGMVGADTDRTVAQVHQSFVTACKAKVNPLEAGACPGYANTFVGAESAKVGAPTTGGPVEVCTDTYWWLQNFKTAEIDLKLTPAALPKAHSLLAADLNRFGSGGVGPSSPRGLKWREYAWKHGKWPTPPAVPQQLSADGGFAGAFVQTGSEGPKKKPLLPGADSDENTPRGLPKYSQNPVVDPKLGRVTPQSATKYQILPGSPDGVVPPVELPGDLFTYCANQFSEIMMGFAQTAWETTKMTKSWCAWQASITSWVGKKEESGHPDWTHRTCSNMQNLVAFALKDQLADKQAGLSAQQVCKNIFNAINSVHRTDDIIVKEAWAASLRGAPSGLPKADDSKMKKLLEDAQQYANKIFGKLRAQKSSFEKLNNAKMDTAAFDASSVQAPAPPAAPDLPDSGDLDPTALLAWSVEHVRESRRLNVAGLGGLSPWGREA